MTLDALTPADPGPDKTTEALADAIIRTLERQKAAARAKDEQKYRRQLKKLGPPQRDGRLKQ